MRDASGIVDSAQNTGPTIVPWPPAPELEVIVHQDPAGELPDGVVLEPVAQD